MTRPGYQSSHTRPQAIAAPQETKEAKSGLEITARNGVSRYRYGPAPTSPIGSH